MLNLAAVFLMLSTPLAAPEASPKAPPIAGKRVVFLGDSITHAGYWIAYVEAFLRATDPAFDAEFLNLGLPSETVSGLSEPGHAGGAFPRPELRERLKRVLDQTKPDWIVACYGMNDGMYYPLSDDRFKAFQNGIIELREQADAVHSKVLHISPPVFDAVPIKPSTLPAGLDEYRRPFEGYDDVLAHYTAWLIERKADGWDVVDIHTPLKNLLETNRKTDSAYRFADDGVHLNTAGHWLIAREILKHWGVDEASLGLPSETAETVFGRLPNGPAILKLVETRQGLLKDAWLTSTGHKRPGMSQGLPLAQAQAEATAIDQTLKALQTRPR